MKKVLTILILLCVLVYANANENITFADANVKAICVANWDTDDDGELSEAEAAAVTELGEVFKGNTEITSFEELQYFTGLTSIGNDAFYHCSSLTSVSIPNSVTSIGRRAFVYCSGLTYVNIPNSVTSIGNDAFCRCSGLASITIPNSVTTIGEWAFSYCSGLTYVSIPNSLTSIGESAFGNCTSLTKVIVSDIAAWCNITFGDYSSNPLSVAHHLYSDESTEIKDLVIPEGVTSIGFCSFNGCSDLTSVSIPNSVTSIGNSAFSGCSGLTSVSIPNSVTNIGNLAFDDCSSLTSITIPNSVTTIGGGAFRDCSSLTKVIVSDIAAWCNITFEESTSNPLYYAHHLYSDESTEIKDLVIPEGVTSISENAFYYCYGLNSITIPNSVTSIGGDAFWYCSGLKKLIVSDIAAWCNITFNDDFSNPLSYAHHLYSDESTEITDLVIPEGVTSISERAFQGCSGLTSVSIPNSVTSIGSRAFMGCSSFTKVIVSDIAAWCNIAFGDHYSNPLYYAHHLYSDENTEITDIWIPESVTSIGSRAFMGCSSLTSISIPKSVTSIGGSALRDCSNLTSVVAGAATPLTIDSNTFTNRANAKLYVPVGSKAAYLAADYWKQFKEIKEFIEGDVNMDGETDVVDVVDIARYVVGTPAETFVKVLADINSDGGVDIGDAVTLVNDIAGDQNFARAYNMPKNVAEGSDELTLTESSNGLSLCLANQRDYTAFQFDLYVPEETDVMQMQLNKERKQKHQLLYNKVEDGHWRVVALSTSNRTFAGNDGELLNLTLNDVVSNVTVCDIIFFDTMGNSHPFSDICLGNTTKIDLATSNPQRKEESVYTLDGRRINGKPSKKGIYIINGKKFIMK